MHTITPWTLKMLQVRANRVCTRISFFVSKAVREIRAFFLSMTKIQLKRVNELCLKAVSMPTLVKEGLQGSTAISGSC